MLKVTIPSGELYDELNNEFVETKETTISLEHSLVSISKWESKWEKAFLGTKMTHEESIDYIKCMTLTQNVDPNVYRVIPDDLISKINEYSNSKQSATWFREDKKQSSRKVITSEVIYYWMISCGIPFECQKWHLNRLLTLIRVCQEESKPSRKMTLQERNALNMARRNKFKSKG